MMISNIFSLVIWAFKPKSVSRVPSVRRIVGFEFKEFVFVPVVVKFLVVFHAKRNKIPVIGLHAHSALSVPRLHKMVGMDGP